MAMEETEAKDEAWPQEPRVQTEADFEAHRTKVGDLVDCLMCLYNGTCTYNRGYIQVGHAHVVCPVCNGLGKVRIEARP